MCVLLVKLRLHNDFAPCLPINDSMKTYQLEYYITLDCDWLGGGHMAQDGLIRAKKAYFRDFDGNRMKPLCFHPGCLWTTGRPILLLFSLLCFTDYMFFHKLKARLSTGKKMMTLFIAVLALLSWPGTEPATPLRWACKDLLALDSSGRTWERLSENKANTEESKAVTWREREGGTESWWYCLNPWVQPYLRSHNSCRFKS